MFKKQNNKTWILSSSENLEWTDFFLILEIYAFDSVSQL